MKLIRSFSEGNTEKTSVMLHEFLNNHIGYEKGEDGKYPKGSIKDIKTILFSF